MAGLSPLARGTRGPMSENNSFSRFIPAGAGNTFHNHLHQSMISVYPRWRGEHFRGVRKTSGIGGLSPLARGTRCIVIERSPRPRFIPAGAGNTVDAFTSPENEPVYPRWRGEHRHWQPHTPAYTGLSPLARGTHPHFRRYESVFRFIPAGAGNTQTSTTQTPVEAVYPRWRGEHFSGMCTCAPGNGLSPLARGTPHNCQIPGNGSRFIPAGAGNTLDRVNLSQKSPVYPRWRGEHLKSAQRITDTLGLSPLARGTHYRSVVFSRGARFIPAGAGNTPAVLVVRYSTPVYPRWRGEHFALAYWINKAIGLSPLARGTL